MVTRLIGGVRFSHAVRSQPERRARGPVNQYETEGKADIQPHRIPYRVCSADS